MNLITLGLGGALLLTFGLGSIPEVIIPSVYAAIPAGATAAERSVRHAEIHAERQPSISVSQRDNTQPSRRRN